MFEPVRKPEASGPPSGRTIPALAALARPALMEALQGCCAELSNLAGLSASEIVLRHGGGLVLVEQGVTGYDQVILTLAVERPGTAVIVISDQLPGHMVRALMKLEASDIHRRGRAAARDAVHSGLGCDIEMLGFPRRRGRGGCVDTGHRERLRTCAQGWPRQGVPRGPQSCGRNDNVVSGSRAEAGPSCLGGSAGATGPAASGGLVLGA